MNSVPTGLLVCRLPALFALMVLAWPGSAAARDDWQLWLEERWSAKLTKTLKLAGKTEERYQSDMSDFYSQIASVWLSWKPVSWLKLEPTYYYQWTEKAGRDTNENRIFLGVTPGWTWGWWRLEDRHRIVFRHINGRDDWNYRNRPKLSAELGQGWSEVVPYVADEVFYGGRAGEWFRHRLTFGVEKPLTDEFGVDLYYHLESNKTGRDWNEFHVLGMAASLAF